MPSKLTLYVRQLYFLMLLHQFLKTLKQKRPLEAIFETVWSHCTPEISAGHGSPKASLFEIRRIAPERNRLATSKVLRSTGKSKKVAANAVIAPEENRDNHWRTF